jgi:general secretion pathway protein L
MDSSTKSLQALLATLRSTGKNFLGWWLTELGSLVPLRIRQWWLGTSRIVVVTLHELHAVFSRPTSQGVEELFRIDAGPTGWALSPNTLQARLEEAVGDNYQILIGLPTHHALQRTLTLPSALAENLRQTLGFELDRYTPFRPDQAYFDYRVSPSEGGAKTIRVDLAAVPRNTVDRPVADLAHQGIDVEGVVLLGDLETPADGLRNFLPATSFTRRPSVNARRRITFIALALMLLLAVLIIPLWQKRMTAIVLLQPVAQAQAAAKETDDLRERLMAQVDTYNFLLDKKWAAYSATEVLEELTKLLPDDTYVMGFNFDGQTIQIQGETASSINMIEALEASPLFKDVAYKSPVTKMQGTPYDRFHIGATLEGTWRPQPTTDGQPKGDVPPVPAPHTTDSGNPSSVK